MLCLVLGYKSRDRESVPALLYAGHDKGLALEILEAGAPDVIRTEYISHLPPAAKNRTFTLEEALAEEAPVDAAVEQLEAPKPAAEPPAEETPAAAAVEQLEAPKPAAEPPAEETPAAAAVEQLEAPKPAAEPPAEETPAAAAVEAPWEEPDFTQPELEPKAKPGNKK